MHHITMPDKTTLYVKDWGAGEPVILLAGWPFGADSWDDQAVVIAGSGYRVIAYDRRGFGRSSQPWGGYDYDTLADDLATVIQQTGVQNATLVGFSMGGVGSCALHVAPCRPVGGQDRAHLIRRALHAEVAGQSGRDRAGGLLRHGEPIAG